MSNLIMETWPIERLIGYARNPRKNDTVVDKMVASFKEFGFRIPIIAMSDGLIVDGHLRLKAAKVMGMTEVPVCLADDMTKTQIKAFRILANQSANWAQWDAEMLSVELAELKDDGFDLSLLGFDDLDGLMDIPKDSNDPKEESLKESFGVLVECITEQAQAELLERLNGEGYKCRSLIS